MVGSRTRGASVTERDAEKHAKALRYIAEGRVRLLHVDRAHIDALVRGGAPDPYVVARFGDGPFACNCQAGRGGRVICSHIVAVALVVGPGHSEAAQSHDPWGQS